ncbi:SNF2-related protein [Nannocystis sp.]|uniref:SNF2-related protein n=1 Tax=Nannocystis sp. TaxID=1962667 RepID=UPI0025E3A0C0|nr:SNF2-related protein [Nannocystis sp.]MBK7828377.1 Eco57I restriction-modification methylase domain-containing protein [Nannocystis sp.]
MNAATVLDKLLPRWRASLPADYSAEYVDGFVRRNREELQAFIAMALTLRTAKRGLPPRYPEDFAAYAQLVTREQQRAYTVESEVLARAMKWLDRRLARVEEEVVRGETLEMAAEFAIIFAESMIIRAAGGEAVPLMLRFPALAILDHGELIAVRDSSRQLFIAPAYTGDPAELRALMAATTAKVLGLREGVQDASRFDRHARALWERVRAAVKPSPQVPEEPPVRELEVPPDHQTKAWRTEANLQAMRLVLAKEPGELTTEDLQIIAQYSGWGGLSIDRVRKLLPPDFVPEAFGLIHAYYTPTVITESIAELLCPLLPELAGNDGVVRALEPSAGIGRLIRAFSPRRCLALEAGGQIKRIAWTAVEFSKVSATLLRALRPDVDLYNMPFERWVREEGRRFQGAISLVVSNPPYGERGEMAREDPDESYKEKRAYAYFMRRALDLLVPGGIGVFLVPAGFMSSTMNRGLREKLLRRHHLLGAFRLPSHDAKGREMVPGASVVMDLLVWRSRGGELSEVDAADQFIADGDYFKEFPGHILGQEDAPFGGDDEAGTARSWRYKVTGEFKGLPPLTPRPVCTACVLGSIAAREAVAFQTVAREDDSTTADVDADLRPALELGRRVGRYLAALGADEADKASQLWPELHAALVDFAANFGNPWRSKPLRELAEVRQRTAAQQLLSAFDKTGDLIDALREAPTVKPKYTGQPGDILAQAEALFRQQRSLTIAQLMAFHKQQGGTLTQDEALATLLAAEWNRDGDAWDQLLPRDAYLTGFNLWARHDLAEAQANQGDEQARVQVRRLLEAIKPAVFDDLVDLSPQHGYVPLDLVAEWISATLNGRYGPVELEREGGFVQIRGYAYTDDRVAPISPEALSFLGYYNHDAELFQPPKERERSSEPMTREERAAKKQSLAERRIAQEKKWADSFRAFVAADEGRRDRLVHAYNRVARGKIVPTFSPEPLEIARWGANAPKLKLHQIAGVLRVLYQRGGGVFFDVGVGKTYTALAIIARARQEGWVRRPVILVPGSLVWKWHDDILCTLPDYRVVVIGSKRKQISRGARKGLITSETDTPQERAQKWTLLQTGQVDVVVLSFDAMARTKMNEKQVLAYVEEVEAVSRSIALRKRNLEEKTKNPRQEENLSERDRALLKHGVRAWVEEILALPADWQYDPGVAWDDIGIDMLVIDEAAAFKNLYKPQAREDGVPKFMGGGGDGSDRAWQLDFRAAAVRRQTGGAGIVLLTATPAKNSPLEFYNLIQFIDPTAFMKAGIRDPEQFIDRYLKIEYREVLDASFEVTKKSAVTGFKNLDDLRTIIFTYGEFRTAAEVGLKLPRPIVETITIQMDDEQEAKYDEYVGQIEEVLANPNPEGGQSYAILGLLARLSLIALHASLEDGYTYRTALEGGVATKRVYRDGEAVEVQRHLPRPTYESPKLTECAKRVAASPHCGHIIFCEPTAVHQWMREVLVSHGVPRERIAILNAEETKPADRIRIAREFNGLSSEPPAPGTCARPSDATTAPKYDVVIANSVAYEGVDLQVRTCTIHHLDLPWTPADLEQRNGRAVRQGNTLGTVHIYYYFADGSTDGYRFSLIDGKAGWLGELIKSQVRDTNNPAAQQQLTPEDILLMISRNKEKTRALLEDKRKRQAEEARARIAKEAARLLRQAAGRFRDARATTDAERAARLRDEGEQRLADLEQVNPDAWPWAPWMYAVRDLEAIVPEDGGAPVYEGLRIVRPRAGAPDQQEFLEFGQIVSGDEGDQIGLRAAGSPGWQLVSYTGTLSGSPIKAEQLPREGGPMWPEDDDLRTAAAIEQKLEEVFRYGKFESMRWRGASDAWLEKWWPRFETRIANGLAESYRDESAPVVDAEGLAIATGREIRGASILPPTRAGWQRFLGLAPKSGENYGALKDIGLAWWGRKIPQNLLSAGREEPSEPEAADAEKPPASPKAQPSSQLTAEQVEQMQALLRDKGDAESADPPEVLDQRVVENLALQYAAMNDALAMGRASKADREKLVQDSIQTAERITILRGVAAILRGRGYQVALAGPPANAFNVIGEGGQFLAAAAHGGAVRYAPGLAADVHARITGDVADARQIVKDIILDEVKVGGPRISEKMMLSVWRRARAHVASTEPTPAPTPAAAPPPSAPAPAPVPAPASSANADPREHLRGCAQRHPGAGAPGQEVRVFRAPRRGGHRQRQRAGRPSSPARGVWLTSWRVPLGRRSRRRRSRRRVRPRDRPRSTRRSTASTTGQPGAPRGSALVPTASCSPSTPRARTRTPPWLRWTWSTATSTRSAGSTIGFPRTTAMPSRSALNAPCGTPTGTTPRTTTRKPSRDRRPCRT